MKDVMKRVKVLLAGLMVVALGGCGSNAEPVDMQQGQHIVVEEDKQEDANTSKKEEADNSAAKKEEDVLLTSVYASARVGNTLEFGTYEQDNDLTNGPEPIQWEVVEVKGDSIKVVSCYILDQVHDGGRQYTWKKSKVRAWLNEDFLNTAFTEEEQECIKITSVECRGIKETDEKPRWEYDDSFNTGGTTEDKIFIPALGEGDYPADLGATEAMGDLRAYWIRNPMAVYSYTTGIHPCGVSATKEGLTNVSFTNAENWGVRPVMWLKTK